MKKLKYVLLLGILISTVIAKPDIDINSYGPDITQKPIECKLEIANAIVLYSAQLGRFDNPSTYATDTNYRFNPLMNTLVNESLKLFKTVRQSDMLPISALGSAMQERIIAAVPKAIKNAANECKLSEPDMLKIVDRNINKNDRQTRETTYLFIQNYVTVYLQQYGYIN